MAAARTSTWIVTRLGGQSGERGPDTLAVEEPMEIHLDGVPVATTMRTPGHDFELAAGFCLTEGLLAGAPVRRCRYCGTGPAIETEFNVVTVETGGQAPVPEPRLGTTTSSCGYCGSSQNLDELRERWPRVAPSPFDPDRLVSVPARFRDQQSLFDRTGAVHAAVAFDLDLDPLVVREDVGRHNAVDKVVGRLLMDSLLPAAGLGLYVSGRASFELVAKAWAGGFSAMVAVSAPTALAVRAAQDAGITLVAFVRDGQANLYAQ